MKLINNFISLGYAALYAEALALAEKVGISAGRFDNVIRGGRMDCGFYQTFMRWTLEGDPDAHKFTIANAYKDLRYLEAMADAAGLSNSMGATVKNAFARPPPRAAPSITSPCSPLTSRAPTGWLTSDGTNCRRRSEGALAGSGFAPIRSGPVGLGSDDSCDIRTVCYTNRHERRFQIEGSCDRRIRTVADERNTAGGRRDARARDRRRRRRQGDAPLSRILRCYSTTA